MTRPFPSWLRTHLPRASSTTRSLVVLPGLSTLVESLIIRLMGSLPGRYRQHSRTGSSAELCSRHFPLSTATGRRPSTHCINRLEFAEDIWQQEKSTDQMSTQHNSSTAESIVATLHSPVGCVSVCFDFVQGPSHGTIQHYGATAGPAG
jgi:hypothetical protein